MRNLTHLKLAWHTLLSFIRLSGATTPQPDAAAEPMQRSGHQGLVSYATGLPSAGSADRYSVELLFPNAPDASGPGAWVRILDAQDRDVVTVPDCGPTLLLALPPGRYRAQAVRRGRVDMQAFELAGSERLRLTFD